jgi:hypothetical protein
MPGQTAATVDLAPQIGVHTSGFHLDQSDRIAAISFDVNRSGFPGDSANGNQAAASAANAARMAAVVR